jgi:curved DNA-binding protein CbpA
MKDALHKLVKIIASEQNPHLLIIDVAADQDVVRAAQQLYREESQAAGVRNEAVRQLCLANQVPVELFYERLYLMVRILNLADHTEDYYDILQVSPAATQEEIKHAFRMQSLAKHPDTNPDDPLTAESFRGILRAYEILGNEKLRAQYDRYHPHYRWEEQAALLSKQKQAKREQKNSYVWMIGAVVAGLLILVFLVDYQSLMTEKYYHNYYRKETSPRPGLAREQKTESDSVDHPMPDVFKRNPNEGVNAFLPGAGSGDGGLLTASEDKTDLTGQRYAKLAPVPAEAVRSDRAMSSSPREKPQMPPKSAADQEAAEPDAAKRPSKPGRPMETPAAGVKPVVSKPEQGSDQSISGLATTDAKRDTSSKSKGQMSESSAPNVTVPAPGKSAAPAPQARSSELRKDVSAQAESNTQAKTGKSKGDTLEKSDPGKIAQRVTTDAVEEVNSAAPRKESSIASPRKDHDNPPISQAAIPAPSSPGGRKDDSAKVVPKQTGDDAAGNLTKRVEEFLRQYTQTYQQKNVDRFLSLFQPDASENGQPVARLASTYAKTFDIADWIQFRIKLRQCSPTADGATVKGNFSLLLKPDNGEVVESRGSIQMKLIDMGNGFKVQQLNYVFAGKM